LVTDFSFCFADCSALTTIPSGLFTNCTHVTDYSTCFGYIGYHLTGLAPTLWLLVPVPLGTNCFYNDTGLSNYASIPSNWK